MPAFLPRAFTPRVPQVTFLPLLLGLLLTLVPISRLRAQQPVIERVYVTDDPRQDSVFALGTTIVLEVRGLNRWLRFQEELLVRQGLDPQKAHDKARDLVLYIDDAPLVGMAPLALYVDESGADSVVTSRALRKAQAMVTADTVPVSADHDPVLQALLDEYPLGVPDKVIFKLRRDVSNYKYWDIVYDSPWDYSHSGRLGLGYEDRVFTELHPRRGNLIRLELIQPATLWVAILGTIGLGLGLIVLGRRSWLLRASESSPVGAGSAAATVQAQRPPFSLAKVQMAWWTFIILGSFLVIYCVSGEMPDISTTSLTLLGISGGTTALNALITASTDPASQAPMPAASRGLLPDILSDDHGLSLNRLQQVVISLMMGYFFVRTVYNTVAMPVWTDNQILLLGISNATYLGLKWQESRTSSTPLSELPVTGPLAAPAPVPVPPPVPPPAPVPAVTYPSPDPVTTPPPTPPVDATGPAAPPADASTDFLSSRP